jgi:hypothetical protein
MRNAVLTVCFVALLAVGAWADVLEMKDGTVYKGIFVGGSESTISFQVGRHVHEFEIEQIQGITFDAGGGGQAQAAPTAQSGAVVVPAGTRLLVRMAQDLDSRRHRAGYKFTAKLEGDLVSGGVVVAPNGSTVYGVLAEAQKSGRLVGRSELTTVLTNIMINNQLVPITSSAVKAVSEQTGKKTVGRTARGAAIGGLIDGSDGAKTGAKVGLGVSILTSGSQVYIPRGTLLEYTLGSEFRPM